MTTSVTWTDRTGRVLSFRLDIPSADRLRAAGYDIKDHEKLATTIGDPYTAADFLFAMHTAIEQANALQEVEFLDRLFADDESFAEALQSAIAGLTDFFRRRGDLMRATVLQKAAAVIVTGNAEIVAKLNSPKADAAMQRAVDKIGQKVEDALGDPFDAALDAAIAKSTSGVTSGSSSASSESTPKD